MGLFSKIFGTSEEVDAAQSSEPAKAEPAARPPAPSSQEQSRAPATPEPARAREAAGVSGREQRALEPSASAARAQRDDAKAMRDAGTLKPSPRPSVPPIVEARLLSVRPEIPARVASATKTLSEAARPEPSKRGGPAAGAPSAAAVKPSGAGPIKPIGVRAVGAKAAADPPRAAEAPPLSRKRTGSGESASTRSKAPTQAARGEPARSGSASGKSQAEPLELDPLGGSVAPPAEPSPELAQASEDDVDSAFERLVADADSGGGVGSLAEDKIAKQENAELFLGMAATYARPVRDFMLELVVGPTTKQWVDVARPAVQNVLKGARELGQPEVASALGAFDEALERASQAIGPKISGREREDLLAAHGALSAALPLAFDLKTERSKREPLVVHHLLLQVPGVHKVAIDKLYAAGLASLDALCRSTPDDLVALGRLERDGARAIVSRFQAYFDERAAQPARNAEEQARRKLGELVGQLARAHEEFQEAEADDDRERKRAARSSRRARALDINVLLAQLGEVDLVAELERSPTERRILRVRTYIESSTRAAMPEHQEAV